MRYEIHQDGIMVAAVESADPDAALRDAMQYVVVYSQDGPVTVRRIETVCEAISDYLGRMPIKD